MKNQSKFSYTFLFNQMVKSIRKKSEEAEAPRSLLSALLFGSKPPQQRYPQLAGYPRTQEQRNSEERCKGF